MAASVSACNGTTQLAVRWRCFGGVHRQDRGELGRNRTTAERWRDTPASSAAAMACIYREGLQTQ